jgi:hypothetical protein
MFLWFCVISCSHIFQLIVGKGHFMNALEKFCAYKETHMNNKLNDNSTIGFNIIFETVIQRSHPR